MQKIRSLVFHPYVLLVVRLALGVSFLLSGWQKVTNLVDFNTVVHQYNILPSLLADIFATALPFVELLTGLYLVVGFLTRWAGGLTALMMLSFMIATLVNLLRGTSPTGCGCFSAKEVFGWETFYRQCVYMVGAVWVIFGKHSFLSLDGFLAKRKAATQVESQKSAEPEANP
jgi:uncharacterized membrane protein YphA (DoxX/SURF4 family)